MESPVKAVDSKGRAARSEPLMVGVDDGFAMTKIALPDGTLLKIPSKARAGLHGVSMFGRSNDEQVDSAYETEGERFTVTDHVDGEGTRFDEYPFSALNRVIVHHALRVAGMGGRAVRIATGLPVAYYFSGGMPNMAVIERKSKSLAVPVAALSGQPCAELAGSFVFAEGVAAWVDYVVSPKGELVANIGRPAAVVDVGGRTTDCVTVLPGWKVDHARSGTGNIGVLDLYEQIAAQVCARFGVNDVPREVIEESISTGNVSLWGKPENVDDIVTAARKEVGSQIMREVQRRIGRAHDLEKVLFVGGGAVVFKGLLGNFPNAIVPPQPEFANARGLLKYMMHVH